MKLLKTFSLYTFIGFLNAGIGFLLLPVLTRYLSPEDYGIISLINVYVAILTPLVGMSTAGFATVEYYNPDVSKEQFRNVFSSVRVIPFLGLLPLLLIFLLGSSFFPRWMELPLFAYWLILPMTLLTLYHNNFTSFLLTTKRAVLYTWTTLGKIALEVSLTLLFLVYLRYSWDGRIFSALITAGFFCGLSVLFYRKWNLLTGDIRKEYIRQALFFGMPLILHQIGKFVINQSDRLFLAKLISVEEVGVYSVGYLVGSAILIIVTAFSNYFTPFLYERLKRGADQDKKEIIRVSYIFLAVIFCALVLLSILSPWLFRLFIDDRYAAGARYVFWVGLGYFFWAFYNIFSGYIFYLKKTKILGWIAILNVGLNILLNYWLIQEVGPLGAAYATCISFFVVAVVMGVMVNKIYPMPWLAIWRKQQS